MNLFDKTFLTIFLLAKPLYRRLGVNLDHLQAILTAKLTMDNRRPAAFHQMKQSREKKEVKNATLGTMLGSLVMGLFFLFSFTVGNDLSSKLTLFFSMYIFLLAATLITDFTSVLIDVRDNLIILPKPVSDATFVTARLLHIAIHTSKVMLPMSLPAMVAVTVMRGVPALIPFILMVFMATLLSIFLINAVYILILKITTPSKFQNIISYFQIGFAIFIYGAYQLVPRMMNKSIITNIQFDQLKGIRLYPPFWFAEATQSLSTFSFNSGRVLSLSLSILVPLVCVFLVIKYFAPSFNQKLSMINSSAAENSKPSVLRNPDSRVRSSWIEKIAQRITSRGSEYMGFLFTWKMMGRSRDFKLKVYPAFGYVVVMFVMLLLNPLNSKTDGQFNDAARNHKLFIIMIMYFSSFILITALSQVSFSDKFKASWIFHITPLEVPGKVICGAVKSVIAYFYIPVVLFLGVTGFILIGPKIFPNLLLGCFNILTICSLVAYFTFRNLPFSVSSANASKGRTVTRSMLTLIVPGSFGIIHFFIFDYLWFVLFFALLAIILTWMILDSIKKMSWTKLGIASQQG